MSQNISIDPSMEGASHIGTHVTHCCLRHGCKYSWKKAECPVEQGTHKQQYPCEYCESPTELEERIAMLQEELLFVRSLNT